jgi:hypothetical protein
VVLILSRWERLQNGKHVADAYDRLAPSLAATLLIEIITRWFEEGLPEAP